MPLLLMVLKNAGKLTTKAALSQLSTVTNKITRRKFTGHSLLMANKLTFQLTKRNYTTKTKLFSNYQNITVND